MTVGDRVITNLVGPDQTLGYTTKPPNIGFVRSQDDPTTPTIATVVWERQGRENAALLVGMLREVESNSDQEGILIGKYIQIKGLEDVSSDFGLPKSPAASGLCVEAFQLTDAFQGGTADAAFVVIAVDDGGGLMLVPIGDPAGFSTPATIAELEAAGTISVHESARDVASN